MNLRFRWKYLKSLQESLLSKSLADETIFVQFRDTKRNKAVFPVEVKNLLIYLWKISEDKKVPPLSSMVIYDKNQTLLYNHSRTNAGNEIIPKGGNTQLFKKWNSLSQTDKDLYIQLTISQINTYDDK